jgi:UDP-N-acetyl-D-glucosamine dehydrogenase
MSGRCPRCYGSMSGRVSVRTWVHLVSWCDGAVRSGWLNCRGVSRALDRSDINIWMPDHLVASVSRALNRQKRALNGARILLLGVAYKRDIDDLRESPALTIFELLHKEGAEVRYNDPYIPSIGKGRKYDFQMNSVPLDLLGEYDCVLIVTDHSCYDYPTIVKESQLVVDSRNATKGIYSKKIVHR